ncbi:MAG TPA: galactokinase [Blastocatellia bacterium]|nr:galactokinase [Blastocatellia bacterium]
MIETDQLRDDFRKFYGSEPGIFRAPGRVNLIGEHTDYNEGFVLPMAIDRATFVAGAARDDRVVRLNSLNLSEQFEFDLDLPGTPLRHIWADYVEGVARTLEAGGARLRGADLMIASDVPVGAGLSSSAALEVSTGFALLALAGAEIDRTALALAGQKAEHDYVGARVGIMDQLTAALGRRDSAMLIDCRTLAVTWFPLETSEVSVVVCDSRVKHELASSEYNTRRAECEQGVELLRRFLPGIHALRDVSVDDFRKYEEQIPEPVRRRCRHVVTENARTLAASLALWSDRMEEMGRLMAESHKSLRDDYEVSCRELDLLVSTASETEGVIGARMTGGGFGGSTVNLVRTEAIENFSETISRKYQSETGISPGIYVVSAGDGVGEIV